MDRIPEVSDKHESPSVDLGQASLSPEHYHARLTALPGFCGVIRRDGRITATFRNEPDATTKQRAMDLTR